MALNTKTSETLAKVIGGTYDTLLLPVIKRVYKPEDAQMGANKIHEQMMRISAILDNSAFSQILTQKFYELVYAPQEGEYQIGGVLLPSDLILAAGWVKGLGFTIELEARIAVQSGENIIPGYASVPKMTGGLVEFGSYTRNPRMGNSNPSMWRLPDGSAQNRVGLTNPGVVAAAEFLSQPQVKGKLPTHFGINIAVSPGLSDSNEEVKHIEESFAAFLDREVFPTWFTLNVSCPNTEDDPEGNQTDEVVRKLCKAALTQIKHSGQDIPLWVKVSPNLGADRYKQLMSIFSELGVKAVIATNTRAEQVPDDASLMAGVSGRTLHEDAVKATKMLIEAKKQLDVTNVDVIGCGGVEDGPSYLNFGDEVAARQFLTAILFRGPTAAALIRAEAEALAK